VIANQPYQDFVHDTNTTLSANSSQESVLGNLNECNCDVLVKLSSGVTSNASMVTPELARGQNQLWQVAESTNTQYLYYINTCSYSRLQKSCSKELVVQNHNWIIYTRLPAWFHTG